jgi:hypothetical protein
MRTSIDIPDALFKRLKQKAVEESTTLRQIVIDAVQDRLKTRPRPRQKFKYKDFSVKGEGLQKGLKEGDWEAVRAMIYEGHGG